MASALATVVGTSDSVAVDRIGGSPDLVQEYYSKMGV
jgi:hypothetical protein